METASSFNKGGPPPIILRAKGRWPYKFYGPYGRPRLAHFHPEPGGPYNLS
jgi:hypothetical protein